MRASGIQLCEDASVGDGNLSSGTQLARLGFGCVKLGSISTGDAGRGATRLIHAAVDAGVTFFDTADAYGAGISERILGQGLGSRRATVIVATKAGYIFRERRPLERAVRRVAAPVIGKLRSAVQSPSAGIPHGGSSGAYAAQDFSPAHLRRAVDDSLHRLGTDYIDVLQLHGPATVCPDETFELLDELVRVGKVRELGVGLEHVDHAAAWLSSGRVTRMQLPFGILDPEARASVFPVAERCGVELILRGIFGSGLFNAESAGDGTGPNDAKIRFVMQLRTLAESHGVTVHQLAVWWILAQPEARTVLVGINSLDHLMSTVRYFETPLADASLVAAIDDLIVSHNPPDPQ